ncbi:MAG: hypothetical protein IPN60_19070 [Saprospiraceae bacterium]|nr:hypothetical protein [Candidatus Opimibacter skivensis]
MFRKPDGEEYDITDAFVLGDLDVVKQPELPQVAHGFGDVCSRDLDDLADFQAGDGFDGIRIAEENAHDFYTTDLQLLDLTVLDRVVCERSCRRPPRRRIDKQSKGRNLILFMRVIKLSATKT